MKAKRRVIATTSELIRPNNMLKPLEAAEADEVDEGYDEERQEVWEGLIESYNPDEVSKEGQEGDDLFDDYKNEGLSQEMAAGEEEEEQGREPKTLKSPVKVTKAQREKHECTHAPFQSWCR